MHHLADEDVKGLGRDGVGSVDHVRVQSDRVGVRRLHAFPEDRLDVLSKVGCHLAQGPQAQAEFGGRVL